MRVVTTVYQYEYALESPKCDFCSNKHIEWLYPAEDFPLDEMGTTTSAGGWYACEKCHDLIEQDNYKFLTMHAVDSFLKHGPIGSLSRTEKTKVEKELTRQLGKLHKGFALHRIGEAKPMDLEAAKAGGWGQPPKDWAGDMPLHGAAREAYVLRGRSRPDGHGLRLEIDRREL